MHLNFQDKLIIDNSHEVSIRYVQIQVWSWDSTKSPQTLDSKLPIT